MKLTKKWKLHLIVGEHIIKCFAEIVSTFLDLQLPCTSAGLRGFCLSTSLLSQQLSQQTFPETSCFHQQFEVPPQFPSVCFQQAQHGQWLFSTHLPGPQASLRAHQASVRCHLPSWWFVSSFCHTPQ